MFNYTQHSSICQVSGLKPSCKGRSRWSDGAQSRNRSISPPPSSIYELPQVWADYINSLCNEWSWYGHLTFKGYPHPERAMKTWDWWEYEINKFVYGNRFWKKGPDCRSSFVRATEFQKRGTPHFHFVMGNIPGDVPRLRFLDLWREHAGFGQIWAYEKDRGAEFYMSKSTYAWKKGEIDISRNLPVFSLTLV